MLTHNYGTGWRRAARQKGGRKGASRAKSESEPPDGASGGRRRLSLLERATEGIGLARRGGVPERRGTELRQVSNWNSLMKGGEEKMSDHIFEKEEEGLSPLKKKVKR